MDNVNGTNIINRQVKIYKYKKLLSKEKLNFIFIPLIIFFIGCGKSITTQNLITKTNISDTMENKENKFKVEKTEQQWKEQLTPEQYNVMREKGTEAPFTGIYNDNFKEGVYYCASCGKELFLSDTKFDAGCGWPSFYKSVNDSNIVEQSDFSYGMVRTEVLCSNCGGHLGHLFNDGPEPTGLRYFINSSSLKFEEKKR